MIKRHWKRFGGLNGGSCGGRWLHASGWLVLHCGHPTALWPYYALPPGVSPQNLPRSQARAVLFQPTRSDGEVAP